MRFTCEECFEWYGRQEALDLHMFACHPVTYTNAGVKVLRDVQRYEMKFVCAKCPHWFFTEEATHLHMQMQHDIFVEDESVDAWGVVKDAE